MIDRLFYILNIEYRQMIGERINYYFSMILLANIVCKDMIDHIYLGFGRRLKPKSFFMDFCSKKIYFKRTAINMGH